MELQEEADKEKLLEKRGSIKEKWEVRVDEKLIMQKKERRIVKRGKKKREGSKNGQWETLNRWDGIEMGRLEGKVE